MSLLRDERGLLWLRHLWMLWMECRTGADLEHHLLLFGDEGSMASETQPSLVSYCCSMMKDNLERVCVIHQPSECPDQVILPIGSGNLGIPIHDGGGSAIKIDYCPWCGLPTAEWKSFGT
jgi:hypothetical protein